MAALNVTSPDYFELDDISSATVGLYVDTPPIPPFAQQRYTTWETGMDSPSSSPDDTWENISLTFSCYVFLKNDDFDLSAIYNFVNGKRWLQYTRFANRKFKIRQIGGIAPSQRFDGNRIKMSITFVCEPFKYHTSNNTVSPDIDNIVTNPGTRFSRPVYTITHSGECKITVNNADELKIAAAAASPIYIDAERMIAYDSQGANQTKYTTGFFPFLMPGANLVQATNCTVSLVGNWRDY